MGGKGSGRKRVAPRLQLPEESVKQQSLRMSPHDVRTPIGTLLRTPMKGYGAAVDYYRATMGIIEAPVQSLDECFNWVCEVVFALGLVSTKPKPVTMLGFHGFQLDGVFCGISSTHAMFQVSGSIAREGYKYVPVSAKPTRIDLALTVWFEVYMPFLAEALCEGAKHHKTGNGRRPSISLIKSYTEDGDTAQMGSRSSEVYGRIYDKFAESGRSVEYEYAWRWEVELKGEWADYVVNEYRDSLCRPGAVGSIVAGLFRDRGFYCPGLDYPLLGEIRKPGVEATDWNAKIAWLKKQVAPTVMKLKADGAPDAFLATLLGIEEGSEVDEWVKAWYDEKQRSELEKRQE